MDILMAIVVGFIIVVAGYVGFYASQEEPKTGGHNISPDLDIPNTDTKNIQSFDQITTKSTS